MARNALAKGAIGSNAASAHALTVARARHLEALVNGDIRGVFLNARVNTI